MSNGKALPVDERRCGAEPPSLSPLDRIAYQLRQRGITLSTSLGYRLWRGLLAPSAPAPGADELALLARRYEALLAADLAHVEAGYYPRELLHQLPLASYLRLAPEVVLLEMPRVLLRKYLGRHDELPAGVDRSRFPGYYLRTFHWQSDGWLSRRSARYYDAGVEFLFGGTADVMRRMAIPPVVEALRGREPGRRPRVLDVGCGTGRFLLQLGKALPEAKLYGLDLSSFYLEKAGASLAPLGDVSLVTDNAEAMPWADDYFDAVTSVFLFHELPPVARRRVVAEVRRVLAPGGRLVVCDSAQYADSSELKTVLDGFPAAYHEPYYRGYLHDDLGALLEEGGFQVEGGGPHLVSKVVYARKPPVPC